MTAPAVTSMQSTPTGLHEVSGVAGIVVGWPLRGHRRSTSLNRRCPMNQSLVGEFASMCALLAVFFVPIGIIAIRDERRRIR